VLVREHARRIVFAFASGLARQKAERGTTRRQFSQFPVSSLRKEGRGDTLAGRIAVNLAKLFKQEQWRRVDGGGRGQNSEAPPN